MNYAIPYIISLVIFTTIDLIWLGLVAKAFYRNQIGILMADQVNFWPAAVFYLVYPIGIVAFAIEPSLQSGAWKDAAIRGALLGLIAYATYDLTNLATLRGWPLPLAAVDMLWGAVLSSFSAACAVWIARYV